MWEIFACAARRSVMSSWVATQPPFCMGQLVIEISRPSPVSTIQLLVFPVLKSA